MVQTILVEREDGHELARCRGYEEGMRPMLGRPSPSYTFTIEVKNIYYTGNVAKAENIYVVKNSLCRQALIQAEQEEYNEYYLTYLL